MCGVDVCDQLISYYNMKFRHRRTWVPLFLHCLNVLRVNAYLIHAKLHSKPLDQKEFIMQMIEALMSRVDAGYRTRLKRVAESTKSPPERGKRTRLSHIDPQLPDCRFEGDPEDHVPTVPLGKDYTSRRCKMCAFLELRAKKHNTEAAGGNIVDIPPVRRTTKVCSFCNLPLCKDHFIAFHAPP
jgi:hypothetical protein